VSDLVTILAGDVREQRERYVRLWRRLQRLSEPCSGCGRLHFFGKYRAAKGDPVPPNRSYCPECNRRRLASYQCDNRCGTYAVPFLRYVPTEIDEDLRTLARMLAALSRTMPGGGGISPMDDPGEHSSSWSRCVRAYEGDDISIAAELPLFTQGAIA